MMRNFLLYTGLTILLTSGIYALEKGTASYYSSSMNGHKTSSGEVFQNTGFTAAHKSLPLGTYVRVINLKNDSSVVLKVNDRLSKSSSHLIDVTLAAAKKLNFVRNGITTVTVEPVTKPDEELKKP
ncbi:MAG: hypothetical protein RLZZ30_1046 [Bacteroidota bacterium]